MPGPLRFPSAMLPSPDLRRQYEKKSPSNGLEIRYTHHRMINLKIVLLTLKEKCQKPPNVSSVQCFVLLRTDPVAGKRTYTSQGHRRLKQIFDPVFALHFFCLAPKGLSLLAATFLKQKHKRCEISFDCECIKLGWDSPPRAFCRAYLGADHCNQYVCG